MFSTFKNELRSITVEVYAAAQGTPQAQRDFSRILRREYELSFTVSNVKSGFRRGGLWPVDHSRLTAQPRPENNTPGAALASVFDLEAAVENMRVNMRTEVLGDNAQNMGSEFIDITHRGVMNVVEVLSMVCKKARQDSEKAAKKEGERVQRELRGARSAAKVAAEIAVLKHKQRLHRAASFHESVDNYLKRVHPLRECRELAKLNVKKRRKNL